MNCSGLKVKGEGVEEAVQTCFGVEAAFAFPEVGVSRGVAAAVVVLESGAAGGGDSDRLEEPTV